MNKLIYSLIIAVTFAGCSKKSNTATKSDPPIVAINLPVPYKIIEDFEFGTKAAYAVGDVVVKTGTWSFEDALLAQTSADIKNGVQSVRLRNGKISMNFDIDSIKMIKINHAEYGTDAASDLSLWASTNQGATYFQIGNSFSTTQKTFSTDSFKITLNQKVRFQIRKLGSNRVNIDDITFIGAGNPHITFNEAPDNPADPGTGNTGTDPGRGTPSGNLNDVPPTTGDNSNLLFGNPSNALADAVMTENYLIDQKYYVESYSNSRATPNWVSWHLDDTSTGSTARQDNFAYFTGLPTGFYQVQNTSYSGSGFDRGHNCPSADRTSSVEANSSTFLMTNMIPQSPNNNQKAWAALESYLRGEKDKGNEVYIIMGVYGKGGTGSKGAVETINNGKVTVPSRVWKVAVILTRGNGDLGRVNSTTRVLAVDTPNDQTVGADWTPYITTVDAIEAATGYDLLSKLSVSLQTTLEAKKYTP